MTVIDTGDSLKENVNFDVMDTSLPIKYLTEEFYIGTRNTLTLKKLMELSLFAKTLPEPQLFGTFQDDIHYKKTLELMLQSTLETRHNGLFFKRIVLPLLQRKKTLLDVGPGDGEITSWVGNSFKEITAIDTNKEIINALNTRKKILKKGIQLTKIQSDILNTQLKLADDYYDLILLSHILYYVERHKWCYVIDIAYRALRPGGFIAIVLSGDTFGKAKLIHHFGGTSIDINTLAKQCIEKYGQLNVKIFASREIIFAVDLNTMLHIAGFFLRDAQIASKKNALIDYIENNCRLKNSSYKMSTQQKSILIHKPKH